jgi:glycerol-3-phosphate dehydrogenase
MAKLAVDRLVERDGRDAPCRTAEIPLGQPIDPGMLDGPEAVSAESREALASRYGHAAEEVLAVAAERPELAERILPGLPDLLAEAPFSARHEQALTVGDVLLRRTRLGLLAGRELTAPGADGPRRVARALGRELGWDPGRVEDEVRRFDEEADAEGIGLR